MYVPLWDVPERRCPRLLVWGKDVRLCQHPNRASMIVTVFSSLRISGSFKARSTCDPYSGTAMPARLSSLLTYLVHLNPDSLHWFSTEER